MAEFHFEQLDYGYSEPELSNAEKAMLRPLAEPGGPLWKIVRNMAEYGRGLQHSLLKAKMDTDEQRAVVREIQATVLATLWVQERFEAELSDIPSAEEVKDEADVN